MTKAQAARRINRVFKEYNRILAETLNEILEDADMWYGENPDVAGLMPKDRNGDQLAFDGPIGSTAISYDTPAKMLHTRKELGFPEKNVPRGTIPGKAQQGNPGAKTRYNQHSEE